MLLSTIIQGTTFEPLARALGATTSEPALPRPLAEAGTIRRLGAEILEYPVAHDDAVVGARVRDLGLPREAVVNVIVRGGRGDPAARVDPILRAGDRLHVLLRSEALAPIVHGSSSAGARARSGRRRGPPRALQGAPPPSPSRPFAQVR